MTPEPAAPSRPETDLPVHPAPPEPARDEPAVVLGVSRLAFPEFLIEIEATAVA